MLSLVILLYISGKDSKEYPFKDLKMDDIEKVELLVRLPNTVNEITDDKLVQKLIDILNRVVIYEEDDSWGEYYGQYIQYTITKKNGESITIGAFNPFLTIDGIGYKTKYQPC